MLKAIIQITAGVLIFCGVKRFLNPPTCSGRAGGQHNGKSSAHIPVATPGVMPVSPLPAAPNNDIPPAGSVASGSNDRPEPPATPSGDVNPAFTG